MTYGWMGTTLEIDLTQSTIERRETDPELNRAYLGGQGLAMTGKSAMTGEIAGKLK